MARKLGNHWMMKRGEDKFSAQDHFFIFALFVLMELWVSVQGEIQCSCLHTFWQTLMSQFQLGEDDRDVIQSSQHHRVFERSIQVDSQSHRVMRKTSTHVYKVFPYYLRETTNEWPGSSLQVPENHWTKVDCGSSTHHIFQILTRQTWRKYFCKWSLKIISHIISSYPPL